LGAVLASATALPLIATAYAIGPSPTASNRDEPSSHLRRVAVFGSDDRVLLPDRLKSLESKIGMLYEPRSRSVCTAFCVDESTIATAAHCLYRTRGERPLPLANITFRLPSMGEGTAGIRIAGAADAAAAQNVIAGSTSLSTRPPIDATHDWALVRLASPACRTGGLPLTHRSPAELSANSEDRSVYQVGYHGDFGNWRLTLSPPCAVRRPGQSEGGRVIAGDFADSSALILHTCDTGGASSGAPLLVDSPRGPEVVGINVGTYLQSHVLTQAGEVLHRYRSDTVANTAVSTLAFVEQKDHFGQAVVLQSRSEIRRIQRALTETGFYKGAIDGRYDGELRDAIEAFEAAERRTRTGLASAELLRRLEAVMATRTGSPQYQPSSTQMETGSVPRP
jgi:Putative peptidoglycan binding domain/Trypsin-like peptidase domain